MTYIAPSRPQTSRAEYRRRPISLQILFLVTRLSTSSTSHLPTQHQPVNYFATMAIQSSITGALVASLALFGAAHAAVDVDLTYFPTNPAGSIANVVLDNYMGISWELSSFNTLCESHLRSPSCTPISYTSFAFLRGQQHLRHTQGHAELPLQHRSSHL